MSTAVHLPADLLVAADREAQARKMSRNRYIVNPLERALATETVWSTRFVEELAAARAEAASAALEDLRGAVAARRTRKGPPTVLDAEHRADRRERSAVRPASRS